PDHAQNVQAGSGIYAEFDQRLAQVEKRAVEKSTRNNLIILAVVLAIMAGFTLWLKPWSLKQSEMEGAQLRQDVDSLRGDVDAVKTEQSFLSTLVPKDLNERLESARQQAQTALQKAEEISADVAGPNAGTMEERMAKAQEHWDELAQSPQLAAL